MFLYHNLWAALPPKLDTFISDVSELFPGGVYDTKYIADYVARTQASYLEFVFKKELRTNREKSEKGRPHVKIEFRHFSEEDADVDWRVVSVREGEEPDIRSLIDHILLIQLNEAMLRFVRASLTTAIAPHLRGLTIFKSYHG